MSNVQLKLGWTYPLTNWDETPSTTPTLKPITPLSPSDIPITASLWFENPVIFLTFPLFIKISIDFLLYFHKSPKMLESSTVSSQYYYLPSILMDRYIYIYIYMGGPINGGTSKSSILIGFSHINNPFFVSFFFSRIPFHIYIYVCVYIHIYI